MPHIVANALAGADPFKQVPITIWAHRGCLPFFTQETFDTIFWPTLKPVFEELISRGHQILFYGEGNWEPHYETLCELPAGSIIYHLDKGDPLKAAKAFRTVRHQRRAILRRPRARKHRRCAEIYEEPV
jgi:hypothetical protein